MMKSFYLGVSLFLVASGALLGLQGTSSAEDQPPAQNAATNPASPAITDEEVSQAKAIFAAQCGWCHGSYGMQPDKGPRLAGTKMTEPEVEERIRGGKSGYMPSFRRFLNDQQIALMAKYIKSLKPPADD